VPYVRRLWPELGNAARPVAMIYLFGVLYGLSLLLVSLYAPGQTAARERPWLSSVIGAAEAGAVAALSLVILPGL
jgi:hypothetical protein